MSAPVQSLQPSIVQRISFLIARHGNVLNNDLNAVLRDSAARIEELERDLAETEREVDAFSTISPLQYQKEAATLQARAEQAERAVDVLKAALRIFVPPRNGPMEDALWGNQPDDALMTIRIKFGEYKKARAALESKP